MLRFLNRCQDGGPGRLVALGLMAGTLSVVHGCMQPNNSVSNSRSELERFMATSQDIRELFDLNIYARDTFVLDSGDVTFRVAEIESKTKGNNGISPSDDPITTSFGRALFAIVSREDRYEGIFSQRNSPTAGRFESFYQAFLSRQVLFLKLGSDDTPFLGWEFVGFDLGKPLANVSDFVTIRRIPAQIGFPTILSNQLQETDLPADLRNFTFLFNIKSVKAGDSIDIRTKIGPMTIFARTNLGFRQLSGRHNSSDPANVFRYGFRTPPADPQNQFYHLLTFQKGPENVIDSTKYRRFVDTVIERPVVPPDTQITPIQVPDTFFDSTVDFVDTCANPESLLVDTTYQDTCVARELTVDTSLGSKIIPDTAIITSVFDSIYDSILLPPDTSLRPGDPWVFPYSVVQ